MSFAPETVAKLAAPLDPSRVKHREGSGGRSLSYLEGYDVIRAANETFGLGAWGYVVNDLTCLGEEPFERKDFRTGEVKHGIRVGYRALVMVRVGDTSFEDVGYGDAQEYNGSKITPHELAAKEAVTDALKRALKNFGDQFGLCLYDKFAPEHKGSAGAVGADQGGRAAASNQGSSSPGSAAAPNVPAAVAPTEKQLGYLGKLMQEAGITDLGKPVGSLTKQECSQFIEQFKSGTFNPPELAAQGAGFIDEFDESEGIPF